MNRTVCVALLSFFVGCQLPPERLPVMPLPEEGQPIPYADLVARARLQAAAANEAFYVNKWADLEDAATGLARVGGYFPKATEVPEKLKDKAAALAGDLIKEAGALREAAQMKDVKQSNEVLQRVNLKVREMRPEN